MAKLDPNDAFQDRGVVKITDGVEIVDIASGKLKVTSDDLESLKRTISGFDYTSVEDIKVEAVLEQVLIQLKIISLKLDCLQPNDEELDLSDLDSLDQQ